MTEAEWLACSDPAAMLTFLGTQVVSDRKYRMFAGACCRRLWRFSADKPTRLALVVVEQMAENVWLPPTKRTVVRLPLGQAVIDCGASEPPELSLVGTERAVDYARLATSLRFLLEHLQCLSAYAWGLAYQTTEMLTEEGLAPAEQAVLLRDIVRGPFRPIFARPPWFDWNDSVVRRIAEGIYEERAFDRLPILGDALEEAGCGEQEILQHCRSDGEHVRGCWVVDWILGSDKPFGGW